MIRPTRIPRYSRSVISVRKQESGRRNHRLLKGRPRSDRDKKAEAGKVPRQILENEKISDTGFEFITTINCRRFRPNLRGFYSFFLQLRPARHNETMAFGDVVGARTKRS